MQTVKHDHDSSILSPKNYYYILLVIEKITLTDFIELNQGAQSPEEISRAIARSFNFLATKKPKDFIFLYLRTAMKHQISVDQQCSYISRILQKNVEFIIDKELLKAFFLASLLGNSNFLTFIFSRTDQKVLTAVLSMAVAEEQKEAQAITIPVIEQKEIPITNTATKIILPNSMAGLIKASANSSVKFKNWLGCQFQQSAALTKDKDLVIDKNDKVNFETKTNVSSSLFYSNQRQQQRTAPLNKNSLSFKKR